MELLKYPSLKIKQSLILKRKILENSFWQHQKILDIISKTC